MLSENFSHHYSEFVVPRRGQIYVTRHDAYVHLPEKTSLRKGHSMTLPVITDDFSSKAQALVHNPSSEILGRSRLAHLALDTQLVENNGMRHVEIINYGQSEKIFEEGALKIGRFGRRGPELIGQQFENAARRILSPDGTTMEYLPNEYGESNQVLIPLTHIYHQLDLERDQVSVAQFSRSPTDRATLQDYFLLSEPLDKNHKPDTPIIIAGTAHLIFPKDIGMVIDAGVSANGEMIFPHGGAPFIDPRTNWTVNVEVFKNGHQAVPEYLIGRLYNTHYVE